MVDAEGIAIEEIALGALEEDPENARLHGEKNMAAIKSSLLEFGQVEPFVVQRSRMRVIGGNGRLRAMREMGWVSARAVLVDLDDARARALGLALNRTAELAEWDFERVAELVRSLEIDPGTYTAPLIGWEPYELAPILAANWSPPNVEGDLSKDFSPIDKDGLTLKLSAAQARTFREVAGVVQESVGQELTDGEVVEMLCRSYDPAGV